MNNRSYIQMLRNHSLKQILADTRPYWDHDGTAPSVRQNFLKVLACGTLELGAEIYSSETERLLVPHTCKSRACPSCGYRATGLWQAELEASLPNIYYVNINFTIPSILRPFLQQNRDLLNDLPAVGASVIKRWAESRCAADVFLIVVPQTFGGFLNFNPHLHMLVSAGGLQKSEGRWLPRLHFNKPEHQYELMELWRLALISYLWVAAQNKVLISNLDIEQYRKVLTTEQKRDWVIYVSPAIAKAKFVRYAGRYVRRPPVPLSHIRSITDRRVQFLAKDTRKKRLVHLDWPKEMFVDALGAHVPDRYRHAMRYFGLLSPRRKHQTSTIAFSLLRQKRRSRPARLSWAESKYLDFGVDPLIDRLGNRMNWSGRLDARPSAQV
jgi:hypothetical protein